MGFSFLLSFLLSSALVTLSLCQNVENYIATERPIAKSNLLANIGPSGSRSQGAKAGVIIASPSTFDPDYLYTWSRDAALVMKFIIDEYVLDQDTSTRQIIDDYVWSQGVLQQLATPAGTPGDTTLGEAKFHIDLTAFTGGWGRPQRDGPALRATSLITYADWLLEHNSTSYVTNTVWPLIKLDCDYVGKYWNESSFDLWEEVNSSSFFTTAVQHRALRECTYLADKLNQDTTIYEKEAPNVLCFQQSYWNPARGFMTSNTGGGRSGIDANSVLTSIHLFDPSAGCDSTTFQPCSDKALSSLKVYVDAFRSGIYPINSGAGPLQGVATGRYTEDVYYGGHPWYLTTLAVAEQLYAALTTWDRLGEIEVTSTSLPFFQTFGSSISTGTYTASSSTYQSLIPAIKAYADEFVSVVARYTPSDGSLAEQYTRDSGSPLSARHLTWSYAAALTAFNARDGHVPPSWRAAGLTVPSVCLPGGSGPGKVPVTFNVRADTVWGENIYITGSVPELQNWSPENALLLSSAAYPTWSITIDLPASSGIQYKYIRKFNGQITWESDPNRQITVPSEGSYTQDDGDWR